LYYDKRVFTFTFTLIYSDNEGINIEIFHEAKDKKFNKDKFYKKRGNKIQENILQYLPSKIIALYSGEETRLYEDYYLNDYEKYIKNIITSKK
jgi:hypothetical protein